MVKVTALENEAIWRTKGKEEGNASHFDAVIASICLI